MFLLLLSPKMSKTILGLCDKLLEIIKHSEKDCFTFHFEFCLVAVTRARRHDNLSVWSYEFTGHKIGLICYPQSDHFSLKMYFSGSWKPVKLR